ncbi:MAG: HAMP domain-containing sensor histidine kinase, partial [Cyclobacteriaceae bacterium]
RSFQSGNLQARVPIKSKGEISQLGTSFNEMADTIVQNIEKMKATENLRRELIANVSHDLRTPIAIIHGYVETMIMKADSLDEADRKKYMSTILESTDKLKKLVADLFELSKLEAKEIEPKKEPFFITELIQDISQKHKLMAGEKSITIVPVISKDLPMVHADVSLIERVLQNLIDNAIKFTEDGGIITIETHREADQVEVKVSDTGEGIPEEEIPHIFERYHTLSDGAKNKKLLDKVSTGLGLAIVKKILEIHNTTINLTSKLNKGSSFYFSLPLYQGK